MRSIALTTCGLLLLLTVQATFINFETDVGAIPEDSTNATEWKNGGLMNATLANLQPGDTLFIPNKTYYLMGGIQGYNITSVVFQLEGTIKYSNNIKEWPRTSSGAVLECMQLFNALNVTFTSSGMGTFDGNGAEWWGFPGVGYLILGENRPRLINIGESTSILIENILFRQSPYWTVWIWAVEGLEISNSHVDNRRDQTDDHSLYDLTAFNTDGFDITGNNVWVHDCTVWNQDDCFCVKDGSSNMVFERLSASGLGLTIGSISGTNVTNITFRDVVMPQTFKGLYMKFRAGDAPGLIANILYENIFIDQPEQYAIWIGPAQQADNGDLCHPNPCSLCWPMVPGAECNAPVSGSYENITLRNITINQPKQVGVIIANSSNPMTNVIFDNVKVIPREGLFESKDADTYFKCENVQGGVAVGDTTPIPSCFQDNTINSKTKSKVFLE
jgi:polygalacturonase